MYLEGEMGRCLRGEPGLYRSQQPALLIAMKHVCTSNDALLPLQYHKQSLTCQAWCPLSAELFCHVPACLQEGHSHDGGGSLAYQQCVQALTFRKAQLQVHQLQQLGFQEYQAIAAVQVSKTVQHSKMLTGRKLTRTALGLAGSHLGCTMALLRMHAVPSGVLFCMDCCAPCCQPCEGQGVADHACATSNLAWQLGMAADTCMSCLQRWGDDVQSAVTWLLEGSVRSEQEAQEVTHLHAARHTTCTSLLRSQ